MKIDTKVYAITVKANVDGQTKLTPVRGHYVTFDGYEEFSFFLHQTLEDKRFWRISEATTGLAVTDGNQFKTLAAAELDLMLKARDWHEDIRNAIKANS